MRIAYLVNRYPAVSHSFVRREIAGIEAAGHEVARFSIRAPAADLPDVRDQEERGRTRVILAERAGVVLALARHLLLHPSLTVAAFRLAGRMTPATWKAPVRRLAYVAEACWLANALHRGRVEHLHAHFGTNPAAVARLVGKLTGIPYSFTVHGPDEFDAPVELDLGGKASDAAFTVAISRYGRSQLMRWTPVDHWPRLAIVRCGVEPTALQDGPTAEREGFCCVARLSAQKGLPVLLDAVALLRARGRLPRVVVIGDGEMRAELAAAITRRGLGESIELVGSRDGAAVLDALRRSRAMVLPSFAEGLPVVLMEAFATGTPVITTTVAGIPELVDERCGWLVPPGSPEALANAMAAAMDADAALLAEMGAEGRRRVAQAHDSQANAAELATLIERSAAR